MAITNTPTQAAYTWDTEYTASVEDIANSDYLIDNHNDTMPTLRIMMANAKRMPFNPKEEWGYQFLTEIQDSYGMTKNQVYESKAIDPLTRQTWSPEKFYSSATINSFDKAHYANEKSTADLAKINMQAIRQALTWRMNYDLWSKWNELDNDTLEINLQTTLATAGHRNPPRTILKYNSPTNRMYSIPMLCRKHVTGHTIGNVSSALTEWQPYVQDNDSGNITRATTGNNIDMVTSDNAGTNTTFTLDILKSYLSVFMRGMPYEILVAMPTAHYNYLEDVLIAERQRSPADNYIDGELGIEASLKMRGFRATFYAEPMLDFLWPYSIFFFDPDCLFPVFDEAFAPEVIPYEKVSKTNQWITTATYNAQLVSPDRVALGAMHGYVAS